MDEPWDDYDRNPYYSPEKCGLELVGVVEYSSGSYEFDTRAVWRVLEDGRLVTARDSGCSCPSPFENLRGLADLEPLDLGKLREEYDQEARREYADFDKAAARDALASIRRNVEGRA